jgi:hypothetical protein
VALRSARWPALISFFGAAGSVHACLLAPGVASLEFGLAADGAHWELRGTAQAGGAAAGAGAGAAAVRGGPGVRLGQPGVGLAADGARARARFAVHSRAANSGGLRGPTGPLVTPSRAPWILFR